MEIHAKIRIPSSSQCVVGVELCHPANWTRGYSYRRVEPARLLLAAMYLLNPQIVTSHFYV